MQSSIIESLDACAQEDIDICEDVYPRFFHDNSAAYALMDHTDIHMKGRMLAETLELLITESPNYLEWEVANHLLAYNVNITMYGAFFQAIQDSVAAALGAQWNETYALAWKDGTDKLLREIQTISEAS